VTGNLNLGSNSSVGGYGDMTLDVITSGSTSTLTKTGANTLNLNTNNTGTLLGPISVALGVLKLGNAGALGGTASATTVSSGAVLDLNGQSIVGEGLTIAGAGFGGAGTISGVGIVNSLGALINSSSTAASWSGTVALSAATSIGGSRINALSGVTSGDITLGGVVSGNQTLTKVGTNTLFLTAANTYDATTINLGRVVASGAGTLGDAGTVTLQMSTSTPSGGLLMPDTRLTLDNTASGISRLNSRPVTLNGGHLELIGNAGTAVNETLVTDSSIAISQGHNVITLDNAGANLRLTTQGTGTLARANQATVFIRGDALGQGTGATNTNIILATTTAPTNFQTIIGQTATSGTNTRILPWAIADVSATSDGTTGTTMFATYDATNGIRPLTAGEMNAPAASGTVVANSNTRINAANVTLGTAATGLSTTVLNSLTFETGGSLVINTYRDLRLDSGGILAKASATINVTGTGLSTGAITGRNSANDTFRELIVHTFGASTVLTSNAAFGGAFHPTNGGFTKTGNGKLILNSPLGNNYTGGTRINGGTLELASAAPNNALFYRFATAPVLNATTTGDNDDFIQINAGGVIELNGNSQIFGDLLTATSTIGSGGILQNSGALATFITTVNTAREWTGQINGNLNFIKSGGTQFTMRDDNQFNGNMSLMGSITALVDQGRLSGMGAGDTISIRNSLLRWDDSGIQGMSNRISSAVAYELDGGAFEFVSRSNAAGSVTLGNLSLVGGNSVLRANPGNTGVGSATVNLGGTFTRTANSSLTFVSGAGVVGANPIFYAMAPELTTNTNGILGAWATVVTLNGTTAISNAEFATYDPVLGIRQLNFTEQSATFAASTATSNLRLPGGTYTVGSGGQTINSLTLNGPTTGGAATTINFAAASDTLTLASGGLLAGLDNFARTIGSTSVRGRLTTSASTMFLHIGDNTLTINSDIGAAGTGTFDLVMGGLSQTANAPEITLTNANTYTGAAYTNGVILNLNNQTGSGNAITGNLTMTGSTASGGDTGVVASSTVRNLFGNQIADSATVTVRGGALWDLNGFNETISKLAFNSQGGITGSAAVLTGIGTLTLTNTADTISASGLDDVRVVPTVHGRLSLPSTSTITVAEVANGLTAVSGTAGQNNQQIGLALNSNIVSGGTINKEGPGVLQLGGYSNQTLNLNVNAGTLVLGPNTNSAASNYEFTSVNLAASGTILDMRGNTNIAIGTISGVAGSVIKNFNTTVAGTLVTGDSTSGTFAGTFVSDYTTGLLNVTKIGSGTWTLTGNSSGNLLGTLNVVNGTTALDQATGQLGFVTTNLVEGGTLTLNNTVANRLGGPVSIQAASNDRIFNNRGGVLNYSGGNATAVAEALATVSNVAGQSQWNLTQSSAGQTRISIATLSAQSGTNHGSLILNAGATGTLGGAAPGANRVSVIATTPNLVGTNPAVLNAKTNGVRPDIIGIDSSNTTGGFVTHDANGFRLLNSNEYQDLPTSDIGLGGIYIGQTVAGTTTSSNVWMSGASGFGFLTGMTTNGIVNVIPSGASVASVTGDVVNLTHASAAVTGGLGRFNMIVPTGANARASGSVSIQNAVTIQSLTLNSGGGIGYFGGGNLTAASSPNGQMFGLNGALNSLTIGSGGVIANAGNIGFSGGSLTSASPLHFHVLGSGTTLNVDSILLGAGGIVKSEEGLMILNALSYNSGATSVNNGTMRLGAGLGANPLLVAPTATVPAVADLNVNGGIFDLNGNLQAVRRLTQNTLNVYANGAGTVTNSSGSTATMIVVQDNNAITFSGAISGGNINFEKQGSNTLTLLSASNLGSGNLVIRGGALTLRDSATITTTGSISLPFGQLNVDNTGLEIVANRIGTTPALNLTGGTFAFLGGPTNDTLSLGTVTINGGASTINNTNFGSSSQSGSTSVLTLAALTRTNAVQSTINFSSAGGTLGGPVTAVVNAANLANANQSANPQIVITSAPTMTNGIIGGWAVVNGFDWAVYRSTVDAVTGAFGVGAMGTSLNGTTPFGNYTGLTNVATDNNSLSADTNNITTRTINSLAMRSGTATATMAAVLNAQDQFLTLASGGLLSSFNTQGTSLQGGRVTAGTAANSTLYNYANSGTFQIISQIANNGGGAVNFVKSGGATTVLRAEPRNTVASTTAGSSTVTTSGTASTNGLVVGMTAPAILNIPGGSVITSVGSGTTFTISQNVGTASATAAQGTYNAPVTQVLANQTLNSGTNTITVPAGTLVYPGMTVTTAVGSTGVLGASTTVLGISGTTVTLSTNVATSGAATLLFGGIGNQTAPGTLLTSGTNTFSVAPNTYGLVVGQIVTATGGTGAIPANTYISAYDQSTGLVTLSNPIATGGTPTSFTFAAPVERSVPTATTLNSSTVKVLSSLGMFVGQPIQGPGIPFGATVASIVDGTTVTLSVPASSTGTSNAYYGLTPAIGRTAIGATSTSSNSVTLASASEVAGLAAGMYVQGVGIPQNTVIGSVSGTTITLVNATTGLAVNPTATHAANNLTFGAPIANYTPNVALSGNTNATNTISNLSSTANLAVGMQVYGVGIPNGATIASIVNGTSITISVAAVGTVTGNALTFSAPPSYYSNSYTGETVVNQGTLQIGASTAQLGGIQVPGNLILNNASATQNTNNGSIASTSNVTINGGGVLTLVGANTLSSITFNNTGGTATPSVTGGTIIVNGNITATNDNYGFTPTIASIMELNGLNKTITVNGTSPMGLVMSGVIQNTMSSIPAGLIKAGSSSLVLSGASTFNGGVQLNDGSLILNASSTPSTVGATVTSGPLGTGTLTIGNGTALLTGTAAQILANAVVVNGNFTFGGTAAANSLTLNGTVDLGGANRIITVPSPQVTATIGGIVSNGGLTKSGNGILVLGSTGSSNTYNGPTVVNGGLLRIATGSTAAIPTASAVSVLSGGTLDLNNVSITLASLTGNSSTTGGLITNSASSGTVTLTVGDANSTSFGGSISNNVGSALNLTKVGTGSLTLGGPNSYSGFTTVNQGSIILAANNALPAISPVMINATTAGETALLDMNGFNNYIASLTFGGVGATSTSTNNVATGSGTLTLLGGVTYDASGNPLASTLSGNLSLGGTGTGTGLPGSVTRSFAVGDSSSVAAGTAELNITALITDGDAGDNLSKTGAGTLALSNSDNSYSGITTISGGVLQATKLANGGQTSSIGDSGATASNLVVNGGTLSYIGSGATNGTTNREFVLGTAGGGLDASGAAGSAMVFTSTAAVTLSGTNASRTFTLSGSNTDANTLAGSIGNNGTGATTLVKNGTGNWVMTGSNGYTGATTVNGGVLQVGTTATAGTATLGGAGAGAVAVNAGATLTGTGTVAGNVTVQGTVGNLGVLTPGDNFGATKAQMNLGGSLTVTTGGQLQFQLTTPTVNAAVLDPTFLGGYSDALAYLSNPGNAAQLAQWNSVPTLGNSDFINVAGGLTINANRADGNYGSGIIQLFTTGYTPQFGDVFNLIDWVGAMGGATFNAGTGFSSGGVFGDFDLPTLAGGYAWDTSAFVQYGVIVVVPEPGRALLMLLGLMALFFRRRRRD
jgi:autotransporter-associated beta strand protein